MARRINQPNSIKSVSAWLIVSNGVNKGKVALQRRAMREGRKLQSFPYVFQPTWNEKLERGETIEQAVARGAREELGGDFVIPPLKMFYKSEYIRGDRKGTGYNFMGTISEEGLNLAQLHSGAFLNFFFLGKEDLPEIKSINDRDADPKTDIVFFNDQLEAVKKIFE